MALEGELLVRTRLCDGHVGPTRVVSTRPDVAARLLQGRRRAEIVAAVPRLFSICSRSQGAASELACAVAAGEAVSAETLAGVAATVADEMVQEGARSVLLQWPGWIGETPTAPALAAARGAAAFRCRAPAHDAAAAVADAVFGMPAAAWLALGTPPQLRGWAEDGATAAARVVRREIDAAQACNLPDARLLDPTPDAAAIGRLAHSVDRDTAFAQQPTWDGVPAETGPLARRQTDPPVRELLESGGMRVPARLIARLRELADLLGGRARPSVGASSVVDGGGVAWVDNVRGLLIHLARFDATGRASCYRIVAPTEWNFHPAGAVPLALDAGTAPDRDALAARASAVVRSLDPCVAWRLEIESA